jgi:hypothetical protein
VYLKEACVTRTALVYPFIISFMYPHQQMSIDENITQLTEAALSTRLVINGSKRKQMKINRNITSAEQELFIDMFFEIV